MFFTHSNRPQWQAMLLITTLAFGLGLSQARATTACQSSDVRLQVLGSGGPELDDGRASSSYLIWQHDKARVLVDVGPGSSVNFGTSGADFSDVKALLLTHLHVDHSADLPAFIKGSYFTSRSQDLPIWGPQGNALMPSTKDYVTRLLDDQGAFAYLSDYTRENSQAAYHIKAHNIPLTPQKPHSIKVDDNITITASPVHHGPVAAVAWRVDIADCSITLSGDMSNQYNTLATLAKDSDLLVMHNAVPQGAKGAAINLHMRPVDIGKIAKQANAKHLLLSHFMNRTGNDNKATIGFIKQHFAGPVEVATDMAVF